MSELFQEHFIDTYGHSPQAGNLRYTVENGFAVR
jgi:hypothetical protein